MPTRRPVKEPGPTVTATRSSVAKPPSTRPITPLNQRDQRLSVAALHAQRLGGPRPRVAPSVSTQADTAGKAVSIARIFIAATVTVLRSPGNAVAGGLCATAFFCRSNDEAVDAVRVTGREERSWPTKTTSGNPSGDDFREAVNMTPKQLADWLETDDSKSVGQGADEGESTGHESGRMIVEILHKKQADFGEDDYGQMKRVVSYVAPTTWRSGLTAT